MDIGFPCSTGDLDCDRLFLWNSKRWLSGWIGFSVMDKRIRVYQLFVDPKEPDVRKKAIRLLLGRLESLADMEGMTIEFTFDASSFDLPSEWTDGVRQPTLGLTCERCGNRVEVSTVQTADPQWTARLCGNCLERARGRVVS